MKITVKEEHIIIAKALLREEKLILDVSIITPYGERKPRTSTYTVQILSTEIQTEVRHALENAIHSCLDTALPEAKARANRAYLVAQDRGEVI